MNTLWKHIEVEVLRNRPNQAYIRLATALVWGYANSRCILFYRLGKTLYDKKLYRLSKIFFLKLEKGYGVYIHPRATIGLGLKMPHPTGIVIGSGVIIGENVTIFQQVTLGGARLGDAHNDNYPTVGDGSVIFAGAKLLGAIHVGRNSTIGANAVVTRDVADGETAVGIPARSLPVKPRG